MKEWAQFITSGGIVVYPTETLWGLGADATNATAVEKICEIKGRDNQAPISVLVAHPRNVFAYVEEYKNLDKLLYQIWPGPLTLVLPVKKSHKLASQIAASGFVGFRVSPHPIVSALLDELSFPLTTTSANKSGGPSPKSRKSVEWFSSLNGVKMIEGETLSSESLGSTVVKFDFDKKEATVLRAGDFPVKILERLIDELIPNLILKLK